MDVLTCFRRPVSISRSIDDWREEEKDDGGFWQFDAVGSVDRRALSGWKDKSDFWWSERSMGTNVNRSTSVCHWKQLVAHLTSLTRTRQGHHRICTQLAPRVSIDVIISIFSDVHSYVCTSQPLPPSSLTIFGFLAVVEIGNVFAIDVSILGAHLQETLGFRDDLVGRDEFLSFVVGITLSSWTFEKRRQELRVRS